MMCHDIPPRASPPPADASTGVERIYIPTYNINIIILCKFKILCGDFSRTKLNSAAH